MAQVSKREGLDLLSKLLDERVPVLAFFKSFPLGARVLMPGFVDSITITKGLSISLTSPPLEARRGCINFPPRVITECEFWYGEKRELPEEVREATDNPNESALVLRIGEESLTLFFTF